MDILVVDTDRPWLDEIARWLRAEGLRPRTADSIAAARRALERGRPDFAILELQMPDGDCVQLMPRLQSTSTPSVVVSRVDDDVRARRLLDHGAREILHKPLDLAHLSTILQSIGSTGGAATESDPFRELDRTGRFVDMVGRSRSMKQVYQQIAAVAPTNETVFLVGPTGSGKEVAARTIRALSARCDEPFVALNCGAVASSLIESEIFGHEKGSFTGADRRHQGVFQQADGGTLFLDEVTEMPPALQVRFLRVLETMRITPVGGNAEIPVDVRIIAATNRDPMQAVEAGELREDLYYRLNVFPVHLPRLRDRPGDVELLARHIVDTLAEQRGFRKHLSDEAISVLSAHNWPGNVRELRNCLRHAYVMADEEIRARDLLPSLQGANADRLAAMSGTVVDPDRIVISVGQSIAEAEQALIEATLRKHDGRKKEVADLLGISVKTLYSRLQIYAAQRGDR